MDILYKGKSLGTRRVDFIVEEVVSVKIKAVSKLDGTDLAQALNYLEYHNLEIGMLINFGAKSVEKHRLINPKFKPEIGDNRKRTPRIPPATKPIT